MVNTNTPPAPNPPKLLDRVRDKIRVKHYSIRTETQYVQWVKRFILLHGKRCFYPEFAHDAVPLPRRADFESSIQTTA